MAENNGGFRSAAWFGQSGKTGFIHRGHMHNEGLPENVFDGRPVIGICNTWSELTSCNAHYGTLCIWPRSFTWRLTDRHIRTKTQPMKLAVIFEQEPPEWLDKAVQDNGYDERLS